VTFSLAFVVIIVRGRLLSIGRDYEEAAMDLGASPVQALRLALLQLLMPAIFASFMMVFAISIDDFVISQWLSSGAETSTVPMEVYNATRAAPLPATNAIATVMVVITLASVVAGFLVYRAFTRHERGGTRGALGGVAGLDG
jgi:spermidine/putrescine transport system permease protein